MGAFTLNSQENSPPALRGEDSLSSYITFCLKQGEEFLRLSKQASLLTKPHLIFCGFSLLAKALIAKKNGEPRDEPLHGLTTRGNRNTSFDLLEEEVTVKQKGVFQSLHLCFSPYPIKGGTRLKLRDLLGCIPGIGESSPLPLDEPSAHFAIAFLLSMACRYEPRKWMASLKQEWLERYIKISLGRFPSLIKGKMKEYDSQEI